jgi:hypothetical protein
MQSFFTCTKINDKDSRDQNANQCKMLFFLYFQYKKNENARTEQQIDVKTPLCIDKDNPSRISRRKTPNPRCKEIKMKI